MTEKIQRMWEERGATERDIAHDKFTRTEDQHKITAKENRYAVLLGGNGGEAKSESDRKELEANNTASAVTQAGRSRESPAGGSGDHEGGTRRSSEHSKANSVEVGSLRTEADQTKDLKQDGWSLQNNKLARRKRHARHERCIAKTTQSQQQQKAQMRKLKEYKWLHRQCRQQSSRSHLTPKLGPNGACGTLERHGELMENYDLPKRVLLGVNSGQCRGRGCKAVQGLQLRQHGQATGRNTQAGEDRPTRQYWH